MNTRDLYRSALIHFGAEHQIDKCIEELAELMTALIHWRDSKATPEQVIEEIADVKIMARQMQILFGEEAVTIAEAEKLRRLEERINEPPSIADIL